MFVFTEPDARAGCRACARSAEDLGYGLHLDRVAERRAGAVRFDVADVAPP